MYQCDFCTEYPSWSYPTRDFPMYVLGIPVANSTGGFAACDTCHDMIESERWDDLLNRSIDTSRIPNKDRIRRQLAETVGAMHKQFRDNRLGPAEVWNG